MEIQGALLKWKATLNKEEANITVGTDLWTKNNSIIPYNLTPR